MRQDQNRFKDRQCREMGVFALIGGSAAVGYFILASLLQSAGCAVVPASLFAYIAMMPLSYFGHRRHTFRSEGECSIEMPRFVIVSLIGLSIGALAPELISVTMGMPAWAGFLSVTILVPIVSYLTLRGWVFRG